MTPPQFKDGEGWPFRMIGRVPYRPDSFDDWLDAINDELFRDIEQNESVSVHNGGNSK